MLMALVNRGKVYRFLMKPVTPGRARLAVEAAVKHHLEAPDDAFTADYSAALARAQTAQANDDDTSGGRAMPPMPPARKTRTTRRRHASIHWFFPRR